MGDEVEADMELSLRMMRGSGWFEVDEWLCDIELGFGKGCVKIDPLDPFLGSGPGGNQRGRSPVEFRGNLYVHLSVRTSIHPSVPPEAPQRLAEASQRLAQASQRPA